MTNEWVPIAIKPPEGEFVLIRFDDKTYEVAEWRQGGWWSNDRLDFGYGAADMHVTHWQRIAPPDEPRAKPDYAILTLPECPYSTCDAPLVCLKQRGCRLPPENLDIDS